MKIFSTIVKNLITEKSSLAQEKGKYSFLVARDATKIDIKQAIKAIYGVDVATVRTMLVPKKVRILKGKYPMIKRPIRKKAVVTLKAKQTLDPNKFKEAKK